ncbi:3'-5'-exoribonuclease [Lodderomyces elongisporus]|uniref:3'-5'-exoribonuclease n=1 Tax=Lodderomyces elongisporus TaxID=36914 RepID=UPI00291F1A24|nr:3'-5'-exoribonuclease [Lodderomyces elongisporus]WLF76507.1 3'-5'-exoribonuclease [Lodderomyces elongisporus]
MTDRRRILGPVNLITPIIPKKHDDAEQSQIHMQTETQEQKQTHQQFSGSLLPKFYLKQGIIQNSNGSAYLEIGRTIIEVSVFGPKPIRGSFIDKATLSVETKFLPHVLQPCGDLFNNNSIDNASNNKHQQAQGTGMSAIEHRISSYVENCILPSIILEKYPKSTIDIQISVISLDEQEVRNNESGLLWLSHWITICTSMAVLDTGLEVRDIVSSGCVNFTKSGNILVGGGHSASFNAENDDDRVVSALFSFMNMKNDEIVGLWIEGGDKVELSEEKLTKLIDECCKMSKLIRANLNSYLISAYENSDD